MNGLDELRGDGRMTWSEAEQGWVAAPEEIVNALSSLSGDASSPEADPHREDGGEA